jgi:hypothetical protein
MARFVKVVKVMPSQVASGKSEVTLGRLKALCQAPGFKTPNYACVFAKAPASRDTPGAPSGSHRFFPFRR